MINESLNILWLCTDQQRYDTIHALGNSAINTPNIDRLVETGISFQNAFCQCPVCTPSRGSFLTGRYPGTNRLRQNGQAIPEDTLLVTRLLADSGYSCGLSGKLHLSPCQDRIEKRINDSYTEFYWSHSNFPKWKENQYTQWLFNEMGKSWEETYSYPLEKIAAAGPVGGLPDSHVAWDGQPSDFHQSKWCVDRALDFIDRHQDGPWLFSVNFFDPHHPFDPPREYMDHYKPEHMPLPSYTVGELESKPEFQRIDHQGAYGGRGLSFANTSDYEHQMITAAYYAMIENVDANIGRLLDYLEQSGQRENTLVIFMSDHGEMLGDHGIYLKGPYLYDSLIKVPLILSWPSAYMKSLRSSALVELVDLAPTILEAAGLVIHPGMQGRSLNTICTGKADPNKHRDTVYCEYHNAMTEHRNPHPYLTAVRDNDYKIVVYAGLIEGEFYDLRADPGEHRNLWTDRRYSETKQRYLLKCLERTVFTADPLPARVANF